jgi:predicted nucleic acid-binding Zn finger protein
MAPYCFNSREYVSELGKCTMCTEDYFVPNKDKTGCERQTCDDDRDYITKEGECKECDDFLVPNTGKTECIKPTCATR